MGWSVGYDDNWHRDVGYGVPAICDHPDCDAKIDRGLAYVCGGEPYGGEHGCGLYFCAAHLRHCVIRISDTSSKPGQFCERCCASEAPFEPSTDLPEWVNHKLTDESWAKWRAENPEEAAQLRESASPSPEVKP